MDMLQFFQDFLHFDEDVKSGMLFDEERIKTEFNKMLTVLSTMLPQDITKYKGEIG